MSVHGTRGPLLGALQKIAVPDQRNWRKLFEGEAPLFFFIVPGEKTLDGCAGYVRRVTRDEIADAVG